MVVKLISILEPPIRRYRYDSSGLRVSKQLDGIDGSEAEWRHEHTWSHAPGTGQMLAEHHNTDTTYIVHGPGGTPIYQQNRNGAVIYLHQDHQESTRLVTNATGTVRGTINYDAYGAITTNTNPWFQEQPAAQWAATYHDTETGYNHTPTTTYDPHTGQHHTPNTTGPGPSTIATGNPLTGLGPAQLGRTAIDWFTSTCLSSATNAAGCAAFAAAVGSLAFGGWAALAGRTAWIGTHGNIATYLGYFAASVQFVLTAVDCHKAVGASCVINSASTITGGLGLGFAKGSVHLARKLTTWRPMWQPWAIGSLISGIVSTGLGGPGLSDWFNSRDSADPANLCEPTP